MNINVLNLIKKIDFPGIINTTNRSLNIVKKSIPVYREIRPYIRKEKSIFKVKNDEEIDEISESKPLKKEKKNIYNNSLTFFN